jgi:hypothetical protein
MYNIFFISYGESNQELNWTRLLEIHPDAIRLHGITGIDKVHLLCDQISSTDYFWTVDGDNWLIEPLVWEGELSDLIMFYAIDPITLEWTQLGGTKLWKKGSIINPSMDKGDFCLNATEKKSNQGKVYTYTNFNNSPYEAWKTSFRHCVKLLSVLITNRPNAANIDSYLSRWKSCKDLDNGKNNAKWAYLGYCDATEYVDEFDNNYQELLKINNYDWLTRFFKNKYGI